MAHLHLDLFSGIAGDMLLSALTDAGAPLDPLREALARLDLPVSVDVETVSHCGIQALHLVVEAPEEQPARNLPEITALLDWSGIPARARDRAMAAFRELAVAEAEIHGTTVDKVHFHEVGALDSITDLMGCALALDLLGVDTISSRSVPLGSGMVTCEHGRMPIPAPATALLARGMPVANPPVTGELTTPTGAAMLKAWVSEWRDQPPGYDKVGTGAGTRRYIDHPNLLRVFLNSHGAHPWKPERISKLETWVDDVPGDVVAHLLSLALSEGALDAAAVRFDERIVIRVLHIPQTPDAPLRGHPGALLPIDVAWRLEGAAQAGDALSVRFMRRDGRLAAAADVALTDVGTSGSVRRRLALPLDIEPGVYDLLVGAYRVADGGFVSYADSTGRPFVVVGRLEVVAAAQPPATQRAQPDLCAWRCDAPALIGVDYDLGLPGRVRLWTHWRAGASDVQVAILDSSGQAIAAPRTLAAARGYLSLAFDVPPARSLQVRFGERTMPLPDFRAGERYVPFGDRMALVGISSHLRGAERLVDLDWLSARPIFDDFIVSVRIAGAAHDGVPALGALPTLKWLRGSRVFDRHPLIAAVSASNPGSVVVYDSLSREELPVLDERYQGTFSFTISEP